MSYQIKNKISRILTALAIASLILPTLQNNVANAATYTFTQNSWSSGVSTSTANHTSNQNDWVNYSSSTNITATTSAILSYSSVTTVDDGTVSSTNSVTGGGFQSGTFTNTVGGMATGTPGGYVSLNATQATTPWASMTPTPVTTVYHGATAVYATSSDGSQYVYMMPGANSTSSTGLFQYSISGDSWTNKTSIPIAPNYGAASAWDGSTYIYALIGGGRTGFFRYDIAANSWSTMASTTIQVGNTVGSWAGGGSLTYPGSGDFLYATMGSSTTAFYKYSVSGNSWSLATSVPTAVNGGASLVSTNNDFLYLLPGGNTTTTLFRYSILGDSWTALTKNPFGNSGYGAALTYPGAGDYLYATIGGSSSYAAFLRYSISGDSWNYLSAPSIKTTSVTFLLGDGTQLVPSGNSDQLYLLEGVAKNVFQRYSISTDSSGWTQLAPFPWNTSSDDVTNFAAIDDNIYTIANGSSSLYRYSMASDSWSFVSKAPNTFSYGASIAYPEQGDYMYFLRGGNTSTTYKYSISQNTWTTLTQTPAIIAYVGSLTYPGFGDYLYTLSNTVTSSVFRYSISEDSWSFIAPIGNGYQANLVSTGDDSIYEWGSGNNFSRYSIASDSWATLNTRNNDGYGLGSHGGLSAYPGFGDYIYGMSGNNTNAMWRYSISGDSWTHMPFIPANTNQGASMVIPPGSGSIYILQGNNTQNVYKFPLLTYQTSGSFESNTIDLQSAVASFGNLSFNGYIPAASGGTTALQLQVAANNDGSTWNYIGPDGAANTYFGTSTTAIPSSLNGNRYFRYKAFFTSASTSTSPVLNDITLTYNQYSASGNLIGSAYDSGNISNLIGALSWIESAPTGTTVTVSLRTASTSDTLTSASWTDFTNTTANCGKTENTVTCGSLAIPAAIKDELNDEWLQYKITLTGGASTPTVSQVRIQYVVNGPPQFNQSFGTNGIAVSQNATSTDSDWGKVAIQYSILDADATSGSATPGFASSTFEYNIGLGWTSISSSTLGAADLQNKNVSSTEYTTHTATWNARNQLGQIYATGTQIRITSNDNEAANNTTSSTSGTFTLDTTDPAIAAFNLNIPSSTLTLNTSDNSPIQYRASSTPFNASSTDAWTTVGGNSTSTTFSFAFASSTYPTIILEVRDPYGNSTTTTVSAPYSPSNFEFRDISNINTSSFSEFLSWQVYAPTSTAQFGSYKIYRSTDGDTYSLLTTITSSSTNTYIDSGLTSSTVYYYKMRTETPNGDISQYTGVLSDNPDGQGGTDTTTPTIASSSITTAQAQSSWARITWTTDEMTNAEVNYSVSPSASFSSTASSTTFGTSHSVVLNGLSASTTYLFRVKSTDPYGNAATDSNGGAGYSFTTLNGPIITNVTAQDVGDTSATIFWNTDVDSDSYVVYAANGSLIGSTETGTSTFVGIATSSIYQHRVALTGLNSGTRYYYYVKSTDINLVTVTNTNSNNYYSFITTRDVKAPVISSISAPVKSSTSAIVIWATDEPATSQVQYGATSGTYAATTTLDTTLTASHVAALTNLTENRTYYFKVQSRDQAQNLAVSDEQNFTTPQSTVIIITSSVGGSAPPPPRDTSKPKISNIKVDQSGFIARITFETDKPGTSLIEYGESKNYDSVKANPVLATKHKINLTGLKLGTDYHFRISASDKNKNTSQSEDQTFKTKFTSDSIKELQKSENAESAQDLIEESIESILPSLAPPFIENPEVQDLTENSATITWRTNVDSFGIAAFSPEEGFDAEKEYKTEMSDLNQKTKDHKIILSGLVSNTRYHFIVKSFTIPQVIGKSGDLTFITKAAALKPRITEVRNNALRISWTTDQPANTIVSYQNLKTGEINQKTESDKIKEHDILIENLAPGTDYEIRASGYNEKNNLIEAREAITGRTSKDLKAPQITNIKIDNAMVPGRNDRVQTVISWKTDEPSTSLVYYQDGKAKKDDFLKAEIPSLMTDHNIILTDLKPGLLYRVKIESRDEAGNKTSSPLRTIITPRQSESIMDIVIKNFEETFNFLEKIRR